MSKILISIGLCVLLTLPIFVRADEFSNLQQQLLLLIQQVTRMQSNLNDLQRVSSIACKTLDRNLGLNDKGEDVVFLQNSLEREGFSVGNEKRNQVYGELTASAVTGFQQKYKSEILTPVGLQFGTGFVGKGTRTKLNSIYGCGAKAPDLSGQPIIRAPQAVVITNPRSGQVVTGTVRVSGTIESNGWITANGDLGTVSVFDSTERRLGQANLSTKANKNVLPVSFEASVNTGGARTEYGYLLFASKSTSSVLATSTKEFRLPIKFEKPTVAALRILFPTGGQQLLGGQSYTFTWSGGASRVNLLLISNGLELLGGRAVVWRADNIQNTGSYTAVLPPSLSGGYRLYVGDASRFGLSPIFFASPGAAGTSQAPRISGVQGTKSLQVKQSGTWTVGGTDPEGAQLDFTVDWGDGTSGRPGSFGGVGGSQSAVFAHSYAVNGTYTQIYRVTDPTGLSDQYSNEVVVGSVSAPTITNIVPSSGPIGTVVTITGTRFNTSNNTVHFGTGQLTAIRSSDAKTLQFTVQQDQQGSYNISVQNGSGRSNSISFTVTSPPTCSNLNNSGSNQFVGCFWRWRTPSTAVFPNSPDDGSLAGEAVPAQPGFLSPVPASATALDINWGELSPANNFAGTDYYMGRWRSNFTFDPGTYRFTAGSDDGIRVFVDGVNRLDRWVKRSYGEDSFEITFATRTTVNIRVDYMEVWFSARVRFGWTKL